MFDIPGMCRLAASNDAEYEVYIVTAHNNSLQTDLYTAWTFVQFASLILLHKSPLRSEAAELGRYVS